jgi:hypothetical protein
MSAIGSWKATMSTPMGPQDMVLHIAHHGDDFAGRIESPMGSFDITGSATPSSLRWEMKAKKPMPITVTFDVIVEGDTLSGTAKLGLLGKSIVTGQRIAAQAAAEPAAPDLDDIGPITGESVDPRYAEPFIEVNEWRSEPVPHRYVHGGFEGTDAQFSFYFPPKEQYQGRFFHNTYPMAVSSDIGPFPIQFDVAVGDLGFTLDSGAYYVQTNLGGADRAPPADAAIAAYRVNAAAAKYSRVVASEIYGAHRPYGYLFGGSGGAYQVVGSAENTSGVWDGFLPFVLGCSNAIPSMFTIRMHALRVLRRRNKFPAIMDAINPGGSGDPYAELNEEERAALREAVLLGYPLRGWWNHETLTSGYFANVAPLAPLLDADYLEDFWTKPGYLGSDPASSIHEEKFQFETSVAEIIEGYPRQFILAGIPAAQKIADAHIVMLSGASAGKSIPIASAEGTKIGFTYGADQEAINTIAPGDRLRIDNAWPLALQTYQRHQVPTPDLYGWNQYRSADGTPLYPQRPLLIGEIGAANTSGALPTGRINGKMLLLATLMDIDALPWQADWYRGKVQEAGEGDQIALWFIDNAQHENPLNLAANANIVSFGGALQQGLRDLATWVETGAKPASTEYEIIDTQVIVPADATARGGIQPTVKLQANGSARTEVTVGEPVRFTASVEVPPGRGEIVSAEWDFEGIGTYPHPHPIENPAAQLSISTTHAYTAPGTYFAVLRVASQRQGNAATPYGRVQNLARVRGVVR